MTSYMLIEKERKYKKTITKDLDFETEVIKIGKISPKALWSKVSFHKTHPYDNNCMY